MIAYELLAKKRDGATLSKSEINLLIEAYMKGDIAEYQMAAFLMAAYIRGLSREETFYLTGAMASSGKRIDLSSLKGPVVDKHSTGGVGDKTTLVVAPIVASLGPTVAKFSGRSLGHTGGTIDKLESIPNFSTTIDIDRFLRQLSEIKIAISSASEEINPADKRLYALRDVTATVSSASLIAASIMSKKIATGSNHLVLDVKVGRGAFLSDTLEARELSSLMLSIAKRAKMKAVAVISRMDQPLGGACGNSLEVIEAIETLKGAGPSDLAQLSTVLSARMAMLALAWSQSEAEKAVEKTLLDGSALNKLAELIAAQGGDPRVITDYSVFGKSPSPIFITKEETGFVTEIDAKTIGQGLIEIGAGRKNKGDEIDHMAGIILKKKVGDMVGKSEILAEVYCDLPRLSEEVRAIFKGSFKIGLKKPVAKGIIIDILE